MRQKYADRIPVICERDERDRSAIPDIDKKKYLVPAELRIGQFSYVIKKRIEIPAQQAMNLFIDNKIPSAMDSMAHLYELYKDDDGFLYVTYAGEHTFGGAQ
jgi:GABA(A) receptor-associated protein